MVQKPAFVARLKGCHHYSLTLRVQPKKRRNKGIRIYRRENWHVRVDVILAICQIDPPKIELAICSHFLQELYGALRVQISIPPFALLLRVCEHFSEICAVVFKNS